MASYSLRGPGCASTSDGTSATASASAAAMMFVIATAAARRPPCAPGPSGLEVDELLARHLRWLDLPLAAGEVVADLVPQRLLRLLLAGDDEHGDLAIDVDLADVLLLELSGLRVAVQIRDRSGLHGVAEGQELLARHLRRLHRLRVGRRDSGDGSDYQECGQQGCSAHDPPPSFRAGRVVVSGEPSTRIRGAVSCHLTPRAGTSRPPRRPGL